MSELSGQDVDSIREIHNRWIRAELAGDSSCIVELCADDVRWMPPNAPPLVGKHAIANYLNDDTVGLKQIQVKDVVIHGSGSLAYLSGNYHSQFVVSGGFVMQEARGTHLWIVRKTECGEWRVAVLAWSSWELGNAASE